MRFGLQGEMGRTVRIDILQSSNVLKAERWVGRFPDLSGNLARDRRAKEGSDANLPGGIGTAPAFLEGQTRHFVVSSQDPSFADAESARFPGKPGNLRRTNCGSRARSTYKVVLEWDEAS